MAEPSLFDQPAEVPKPTTRPKRAVKGKLSEPARRALVAKGLMDDQTGATRKARYSKCSICKNRVIIGIDREFGGLAVECDPDPLAKVGEMAALLLGRRTLDLHSHGGRWIIDRREYWHIRDTPPGTNGNDVLVIHQCGAIRLATIASTVQNAPISVELPENPPF